MEEYMTMFYQIGGKKLIQCGVDRIYDLFFDADKRCGQHVGSGALADQIASRIAEEHPEIFPCDIGLFDEDKNILAAFSARFDSDNKVVLDYLGRYGRPTCFGV